MAQVTVTFKVDGNLVAEVPMEEKTFSSKNEGFYAGNIRLYVEGKQYIAQAQLAGIRNKVSI